MGHLEGTNAEKEVEISKLKTQIAGFESNGDGWEDSVAEADDANDSKIEELQNIIHAKDEEISSLKEGIKELEDESKDNNKVDDESKPNDLKATIESKEAQIQDLSLELSELKEEYQQLKNQKDRVTKETEIEINACMNSIAEKEDTINSLENELKTEKAEKEAELKELTKQIDMYKNEKEELNNTIQSEKK